MKMHKRVQISEKIHVTNPIQQAPATPPPCSIDLLAMRGEALLLKTVPIRATLKFKPMATPSSFPKNHSVTKRFCATASDSPPRPSAKMASFYHIGKLVGMIIYFPFSFN